MRARDWRIPWICRRRPCRWRRRSCGGHLPKQESMRNRVACEFSGRWLQLVELPEKLERVNASVVSVVPNDLVGIIAAGLHLHRLRRAGRDFAFAQQLEWVRRLLPLFIAGCARTVLAERAEGDERANVVVPFDGEAIAFAAQ